MGTVTLAGIDTEGSNKEDCSSSLFTVM